MSYSGNLRLIHSARLDATGIAEQDGGFSGVTVFAFPVTGWRLIPTAGIELGDTFICTTEGAATQLVVVSRAIPALVILACFDVGGGRVNPAVHPCSIKWYRIFK